jgi:hypothetical protein
MSFGESVFLVGFNQKTAKGGPICQKKSWNYATTPTWEDSRRLQEALH